MSDEPGTNDEIEDEEPVERASLRQIGFGTVSIIVVFLAIISLMCLGSVFILVVLFFRGS